MSNPLVSFIVATYNRKESLIRTINSILEQEYENFEIVIVCNSSDTTPSLFEKGGQFHDVDSINYNHYDTRMGVIRARNKAYELSEGEIYITIDDDAIFANKSTTKNVVDLFKKNPNVGIIAMKVINDYSGEIEFPPEPSSLESKIPFLKPQVEIPPEIDNVCGITLFTGCGNAIHRNVFDKIGKYAQSFDYGVEEFDLSLRAIDSGFDIVYSPGSTVIHYENPKGRFHDDKIHKELYINRIIASFRNHPIKYIILSCVLWTTRLLIRTNGNIKILMSSWSELLQQIPKCSTERDPISEETIRKINDLNGRVY